VTGASWPCQKSSHAFRMPAELECHSDPSFQASFINIAFSNMLQLVRPLQAALFKDVMQRSICAAFVDS